MANQLISLLDLTRRTGSDQAVGIVEETITYAPELNSLMGRAIPGSTYKYTSRTLPTVAFRTVNSGSDTVKSTYQQKIGQCYLIDAQLQMDTAVAALEMQTGIAANGLAVGLGDILGDEAKAIVAASFITIGSQMYYGTTSDALGFPGLMSLYDTTNMEVSAAGSGGAYTSAWIVWENIQGCHFVFGNAQGLNMANEWRIQQVLDSNSKPFTGYVNNIQGWVGFGFNHTKSACRIKLATAAAPITDKLIAQAKAKFPLAMRQGLKIFMNRDGALQLQTSRSASTLNGSEPLNFPAEPVSSNGIPIVVTDSITSTETA